MANGLGSALQGFQLGSAVREQRDIGKARKLAGEQREVLGGLRRRSLGLRRSCRYRSLRCPRFPPGPAERAGPPTPAAGRPSRSS